MAFITSFLKKAKHYQNIQLIREGADDERYLSEMAKMLGFFKEVMNALETEINTRCNSTIQQVAKELQEAYNSILKTKEIPKELIATASVEDER